MSTSSQFTHVERFELHDNDRAILATLPEWLTRARFERQGDEWDKCTDELLPEKKELIKTLRLVQKVHPSDSHIVSCSLTNSLVLLGRLYDCPSIRSSAFTVQESRRSSLYHTYSNSSRYPCCRRYTTFYWLRYLRTQEQGGRSHPRFIRSHLGE